jgi:ATP-binding cassette, subfamily B, bacterial
MTEQTLATAKPAEPAEKTAPETPQPSRKLAQLRMVARFASHYPRQILYAAVALAVAASATLAIPAGFQRIIDKGFIANGGDIDPYFRYLLMIVAVLAVATALRFYFVSWLSAWLPTSASRCRKTCSASRRAFLKRTAPPKLRAA